MEFTKYEGIGNDILIFDFPAERIGRARRLSSFVRQVADRHFGVGADEVVFLKRLPEKGCPAAVVFYNSDGSSAKMCGNALRCVAMHLIDKWRIRRSSFFLRTPVGPRWCSAVRGGGGASDRRFFSVDMGQVRSLDGKRTGPENKVLQVAGRRVEAVVLSLGNPHAVIFGRYGKAEIERMGKALQKNKAFQNWGGVNVGFATVRSQGDIDLIVMERGCGLTLACGSGACAAAAASVYRGLCRVGSPILVHLPGGTLEITVARDDWMVAMSGPAKRIFSGTLDSSFNVI